MAQKIWVYDLDMVLKRQGTWSIIEGSQRSYKVEQNQ